jgi:hypothetical protein
MGEVYRATDRNLKRSVAIKVLPASVTGDADRLARFQREAEVLAALNHPTSAQSTVSRRRQTSRGASNRIELHPLLDIDFNPPAFTTPPPPTALLRNPGFENGATGWTATAGVISTDPNQPPHTGSANAWLGGYGTPYTDRLSQQVTLPATATAISLTFFLHVTTEEQTTSQAFDTLRVQVRRANGQVTTLGTFSNLQGAPGYTQQTFNLTAFKGKQSPFDLSVSKIARR